MTLPSDCLEDQSVIEIIHCIWDCVIFILSVVPEVHLYRHMLNIVAFWNYHALVNEASLESRLGPFAQLNNLNVNLIHKRFFLTEFMFVL